jgi:hypothetical protein
VHAPLASRRARVLEINRLDARRRPFDHRVSAPRAAATPVSSRSAAAPGITRAVEDAGYGFLATATCYR